jgi:hypothetical protein
VDASDLHGDTPGYASGYVELLTLSDQAESELCAAIAADCKLDNEKCIRSLERCLQGCNDAFGRCIAGHAKGTCDEAKTAMCKDAVNDCLDDPCREAYTQCAQSTTARDQVLDQCGL